MKNVTSPPPELWMKNPRLYTKRVKHAGAKVMLKYIR